MTQGERVREIRKFLEMTMESFGEKLGVGKTAISKIEKGNVNLTDQMAKAICREFNVNPNYLMNGDLPMISEPPKTVLESLCIQYDCDDLDKSIIEGYLKLTASERQTIKKYIKSLYNAEIASMPTAAPRRETIEELEAAYEKSLGIVPKTGSLASSTTGAKERGEAG